MLLVVLRYFWKWSAEISGARTLWAYLSVSPDSWQPLNPEYLVYYGWKTHPSHYTSRCPSTSTAVSSSSSSFCSSPCSPPSNVSTCLICRLFLSSQIPPFHRVKQPRRQWRQLSPILLCVDNYTTQIIPLVTVEIPLLFHLFEVVLKLFHAPCVFNLLLLFPFPKPRGRAGVLLPLLMLSQRARCGIVRRNDGTVRSVERYLTATMVRSQRYGIERAMLVLDCGLISTDKGRCVGVW